MSCAGAQTLTNSDTFPINKPQPANVYSYDEVQLQNNENVGQRFYKNQHVLKNF